MDTRLVCLVLCCAGCLPSLPAASGSGPLTTDGGIVELTDGAVLSAADASHGDGAVAPSPDAGSSITPVDSGPVVDPTMHAQADVCMRYAASAVVAPSFFSKSATTCDPGQLTADGIGNAVARVNFHRWLAGLAPVVAADAQNGLAQSCALVSAWNPAGPAAHFPATSAECYTQDGAAGAGSSNIAWGSSDPVAAIDQWVYDSGNETTMGHRRWILNPPLDPIGFGLYLGGDAGYGAAACMVVFGQGGTGPRPDFIAYPPAGYVPLGLAQTTWTYAADNVDFSAVTVTVTRMSDAAALPVTIIPLQNPGGGNYPNATSFAPSGWSPAAGETYRVTVSAGGATKTYDVKPVAC